MFAPKVAKAQTKAGAGSNNKIVHQRSTLMAHRPGHGSVAQTLMLPQSIGNQATLRLLSRQVSSLTGNEPGGEHNQGAVPEIKTARDAPVASWDFSRIPIFPPDRTNRSQARSVLTAPSQLGTLQPKLVVGAVDDPFEHEADRIADQVMRIPNPELSIAAVPSRLSRKFTAGKKEAQALETRTGTSEAAAEAPAILHQALSLPGQPLDSTTRAFFEPHFGLDFSRVRVHADAQAGTSARAIGALAYTLGPNIVFATGQYVPHTVIGRRLLAHELTHVAQQGAAYTTVVQRQHDDGNGITLEVGPQDVLPWPNPKGPPTIWIMRKEKVTSQGTLTTNWLRDQGYKGVGSDRWVHPKTHDEVLLAAPKQKKSPLNSPQETPEHQDPAVTHAKDQAEAMAQKRDQILSDLEALAGLTNSPDYHDRYLQLNQEWNDLDTRLRAAVEMIPRWQEDLIDTNQTGLLDEQTFRLNELRRWEDTDAQKAFWEKFARLPPP
jgi:hypothetical protein